MSKLCERPGCSEPGAVAYGMIAEDLLFWIAPLNDAPTLEPNVLCRRHADAMVVPRGWTLDDRREPVPRLFRPSGEQVPMPVARRRSTRARRGPSGDAAEQLQLDGTGPIERPLAPTDAAVARASIDPASSAHTGWPAFAPDDDLDGLLEVSSPLLARAFRGTDRPRD